jgi:hypothetical protein
MTLWKLSLAVTLLAGTSAAMGQSINIGSTGDHVRVIIDTSRTMCGPPCDWHKGPAQDPGRLAILSTMLLHDLLKINPDQAGLEDSFGVIPFRNVAWSSGSPPPNDQPFRYSEGMTQHQQFLAKLQAIPFDSWSTHYSSSILRALEDLPDLEQIDHPATTRTIVLITDGLPNKPDLDANYIKQTLLPKLAQKQTRLYVILFGGEATTKGVDFFEDIKQRDNDNVANGLYSQLAFPGYYVVPDGRKLPETMIDLFAKNFGYFHLPAEDRVDTVGTGKHPLDLDANVDATEAVIVALRLDLQGLGSPQPPVQDLKPPPGVQPSPKLYSATEKGGSYSLRWESKPAKGKDKKQRQYQFSVLNGSSESVFVLRPTNLTVDLRSHIKPSPQYRSCFPPGQLVTMADRTCTLDFLIRSGSGSTAGIAGMPNISLGVRYHLKQPNPTGGEPWDINDESGEAIGPSDYYDDQASAGRRYWSVTQFTRNQTDETEVYKAQATVEVKLGGKLVAYRRKENPFEIVVWPQVGLAPHPSPQPMKSATTGAALKHDESACTTFHLEEDFGTMLESAQGSQPGYDVRAFLEADQQVIDGELKGAVFTLKTADGQRGQSIGFAGTIGPKSLDWSSGQRLTLEQMVHRNGVGGEFELCVTLGRHADGDPQFPADVRLHFVLDEGPYGHFDVIQRFSAQVHVDRHPGLNPWALLPFLLLLLGLLAALALLRPRFALPKDLGYGLATMANPHGFQARRLPSASPWKLLFSRRAERAITDRDGELLGWVRPEDDELYGLRPAPGVEVVDPQGKVLQPESGVALLQVHQTYRLRSSKGELVFRMQYL